ncbi:MAG: hypothetical protein K9M54_05925 [Kiritimatiellales bacterium]|nr:hypothetical protein [Kiritimatiellales bacterium]MCF7864704.1 hypothetical protein [Kiritimatiellales bacterium]
MKKNVNPATVENAVQCPHNHACLSKEGKPCCTIAETINNKVFFTHSKKPTACPCQMAFGNSFLCTCPVRHELYLKHRI